MIAVALNEAQRPQTAFQSDVSARLFKLDDSRDQLLVVLNQVVEKVSGSNSMLLPVGSNQGVLACLLLLTFFEGPFLPTIFAVTPRGLGRHTKLVATGLTMAISGVLVWTSVTWAVQQADGVGGDPGMLCVPMPPYMLASWSSSASSTCNQPSSLGRRGPVCTGSINPH
jgi:hypothetical protein